MRAAVAIAQSASDPLPGLVVRDEPEPTAEDGWVRVRVRAASLNPHDLWTLRGVGHPAERIPMILGCDGAGELADGSRVLIHGVIGDPAAGGGDETLDPRREILSEVHPGTFAEFVCVPSRNVVPLPEWLEFEQAACLGVAWGTAYRMLTTRAGVSAGQTVLVQGASGGVSAASIWIAKALGATVWATGRTAAKREYALAMGADEAFEPGARLPGKADVVVDTVGAATWGHSLRALRPGGTIVTCGATSGGSVDAELARVFYLQLRIIGSTMCTLDELRGLLALIGEKGPLPEAMIDRVLPLESIRDGFEALASGEHLGKIVVRIGEPSAPTDAVAAFAEARSGLSLGTSVAEARASGRR